LTTTLLRAFGSFKGALLTPLLALTLPFLQAPLPHFLQLFGTELFPSCRTFTLNIGQGVTMETRLSLMHRLLWITSQLLPGVRIQITQALPIALIIRADVCRSLTNSISVLASCEWRTWYA
jgi:hypothetical protein